MEIWNSLVIICLSLLCQVYYKLQTKPSLAEKLDKYLDNFNKSGQIHLGDLRLSLAVLDKSKSLLRRFLLQNPHLSESQFHLTLKLYGLTVGDTQNCTDISDFLTDSFHLNQTRAAVQLLCKMRDRLTEDMRSFQGKPLKKCDSSTSSTSLMEFPGSITSADISMNAAAHCLFKHVQHQLKFGLKGNLVAILIYVFVFNEIIQDLGTTWKPFWSLRKKKMALVNLLLPALYSIHVPLHSFNIFIL